MLHIISTPIGNLEDMTFRAVRMLKECDYVLAEDTRRANKLLRHYEIDAKVVTFHDHNKKAKTPHIIEDLKQGQDVALISDAGTPCIADPGFYLVRACREAEISISPVPGPSSVLAALVGSGFPTDRFTFYGFIPKQQKKRKLLWKDIIERQETAIILESPYRVKKTLKELGEVMPEARVCIARELTKKFEEYIEGTAEELAGLEKNLKGEIVLLISPS